ncbi:MAG: DNA-packaging protein [Bdellovibrionales bacterium]
MNIQRLKAPAFWAIVYRAAWLATARPNQLTPDGDWAIWLILAGRGWGKTRTGAEDVAHYALQNPGSRIAVVAPTYADARDTCVEGDSGLKKVLPPQCVRTWNRSLGELVLKNGSRFKLFSADEPERLRGPQHHRAWCDELAAWQYPQAFDQLLFGLRLGDNPRVVVTTTPKPVPAIKDLVARQHKDVFVTRGTTFENEENLASTALTQLKHMYEGTRLGRQELNAEILSDADGALWDRKQIDVLRVTTAPPLEYLVVALDPAVTSHAESDETGIVAAGRSASGDIYVLADASGTYTPDAWASVAASLCDTFGITQVVGEVNEGGDLIPRVLATAAPQLAFKAVRAVKGKVARAIPVSTLYQRGRVHHVGSLPKLEDQMCRFTYAGFDKGSPDRVDALVWAVTELMQGVRANPTIRSL